MTPSVGPVERVVGRTLGNTKLSIVLMSVLGSGMLLPFILVRRDNTSNSTAFAVCGKKHK
jgi:hypothetical protein